MKISDLLLRSVMLAGVIQGTGMLPSMSGWRGCANDIYYNGCACYCVQSGSSWIDCESTGECGPCNFVPAWWCT
jgi:hypothetical protein